MPSSPRIDSLVDEIKTRIQALVGDAPTITDDLDQLIKTVADHAATQQQVTDQNTLYAEAERLIKETPAPYGTALSTVVSRCACLVGRNS